MMRSFIHHQCLVWSFVLVFFASLAPQPGAAQPLGQPVLSSVVASAALPDSIVVSGHGFTPGGNVYVALYDQWGLILHETRWVAASGSGGQPADRSAPSLDSARGGNILETFEIATESIYGPNGSQDPSQPDRRGLMASELLSSASCPDTLMVRAFDQQANAWSNVLDVEADCGQ